LEQAHCDVGAGSEQQPALPLWANALRVLDRTGTDSRQLPALLRLSKRAVRSRIGAAARHGWVETRVSASGAAAVHLTRKGDMAARKWDALRLAAEGAWLDGASDTAVRTALAGLVRQLPLEHPHYPAGYGPADASVTGGNGKDWTPVVRRDVNTVDALPLSALISQTLVAFAKDYEQRVPVALSLGAMLTRIPPGGLPARQLGASTDTSALERHGYLHTESGAIGPSRILRLTKKGQRIAESYDEQLQAVEASWRTTYSDQVIDAVLAALPQRGT
jgi:hypothetical protein